MDNSIWKVLSLVFLLLCCSITLANSDELISEETTESVKADDWHEHDDAHDIFLQRLQESYQNGTQELKELIESSSARFSKRLDTLEKNSLVEAPMHESLDKKFSGWYAELDKKVEELKHRVDVALTKLNGTQALGTSTSKSQLITTTPRPWTSRTWLSALRSPVEGSSFNGTAIQDIAEEIPNDLALIVEIVNYLDVNLTDYQFYIIDGLEHQAAPKIVSSKTREVFTFKPESYALPRVGLLYRIGNTGYSLHLLGWWNTFGFAFLENRAKVKSLLPMKNGCNEYDHTGNSYAMKCIERFSWNENNVRDAIIHQGNIYAKLSIKSRQERSRMFLKLEIFNFGK